MAELRDGICSRLSTDLIGPYAEDETLTAYPSDVYLTGILFPQRSEMSRDQDETLGAEGGGEGGDSEDTSRDEVSWGKRQRPSAFGISFATRRSSHAPVIRISFSAARYESEEAADDDVADTAADNVMQDDDSRRDVSIRRLWKRIPVDLTIETVALREGAWNIDEDEHGVEGIRLHITCSPWGKALLATVTLLNARRAEKGAERPETEEMNLFQTRMTVTPGSPDTEFIPRPLGWTAADEDSASAGLIFRDAHEYAAGHTCSARWSPDETGRAATEVETAWLPAKVVPAVSADGDKCFATTGDDDYLSTLWLTANADINLTNGLSRLPSAYIQWLREQEARIVGLPEELRSQAALHIRNAESVAKRIEASIATIGSDKHVETAFRLANLAIRLQAEWGRPGQDPLRWRPFQLGFILLCLSSVANRDHPDRSTADLLWFPTGGGKTEAYLALIAFILFLRRLRYGENGAGVASIMRYTLRLLTVQQFQRAAALICACEKIRLGEHRLDDAAAALGQTPFSIGLWVGKDSVPNSIAEADMALRQGSPSTPKQLTKCPVHRDRELVWKRRDDPDRIAARCTNADCTWSTHCADLPIWTVDEDVYRVRPSLLIGTIDKFAQLVRNPNTVALFATDRQHDSPELIIQDELHLISGPLGTVAGLYECAIDELSSGRSHRPKIIASTATIRAARAQIKALFNRDTCLFPPPVIDASNSAFAIVDNKAPGRLYVGLTTAGRSAKYSLQAAAASLIQSATIAYNGGEAGADWYTTLVTYFNSLRELGGALVLMQDDVDKTLKQLGEYRSETGREFLEVTELTSRVSSAEVREILDQLEVAFGQEGAIDVLLASNMISVGVDISRLGLMVVNGQPKTMSEYIQSTSRVGRGTVPGMVLTLFNDAKARDRSRFETFVTWHSSLYRDVEATSVTPFSSRARDKALHAALVGLVRHLMAGMRKRAVMSADDRPEIEALAEIIIQRATSVDEEESAAVRAELGDIINRWESRAGLRSYWNDRQVNSSLLISAEEAAKRRALGRAAGQAWPTPNSMRNVEPSTVFLLRENI